MEKNIDKLYPICVMSSDSDTVMFEKNSWDFMMVHDALFE